MNGVEVRIPQVVSRDTQLGTEGKNDENAGSVELWKSASILNRLTKTISGCWLYDGYVNPKGYGQVYTGGGRRAARYEPAHRVVYRELVGPIPDGITLHHECKQKRCVNPAHLVQVSNGDHKRLEHGAQQVRLPFISQHERENPIPIGFA